jgi:catalase
MFSLFWGALLQKGRVVCYLLKRWSVVATFFDRCLSAFLNKHTEHISSCTEMKLRRTVSLLLFFCIFGLIVYAQRYDQPTDRQTSGITRTNYGAPIYNNRDSLTVGPRGPTLLEDYQLLEKLANFNRERIPERIVHAVGAVAKGKFTVTRDVSQYTMADFLQPVGKVTPVAVRFSTVTHPLGSPETLRDPRGFAVKFYTEQGNYDLVGNNIPVFFIQDGFKFPDMVHALKPDPVTNRQEWWRIWDFFQYHPESVHMWTWVLDDAGIPRDYRHMDGFGVHTFKWINRTGDFVFVKYHWKSQQGVEYLINEEQIRAIKGHQHATWDLYQAIRNQNYPRWKLYVQILEPRAVASLDFDPLDPTIVWPESQFPLQEVGEMVLNQNVDNFHNENEQIAFCPALVVPGIYYSDDKLLQARLFAYTDTQRYRLGANYLMLPINAPRNSHYNSMHNGEMNFMKRTKEVNYFPSRFANTRESPPYPIRSDLINGTAQRTSLTTMNHFTQAKNRYNSFDTARKWRFQMRLIEALHDPDVPPTIRDYWIATWARVDTDLARALAQKSPTVGNEDVSQQPSTAIPAPPNPWNITTIPQLLEKYQTLLDKYSTAVLILASFLGVVGVLLVGAVVLLFLQRRVIHANKKAKSRLLGDTTKVEL